MNKNILDDVIQYDLKAVFCGTAASRKSAALKSYYAGPNNKFWPTLYETGIINKPLDSNQYKELLKYGIGLTDICKVDFGNDIDIDYQSYDIDGFIDKIIEYQPLYVCFNGKNAAKRCLDVVNLKYGIQDMTFNDTKIMVLPSTSASAKRYWDIEYWQLLSNILKEES